MARHSILDYYLEYGEQQAAKTAVLVKHRGHYVPLTWGELKQQSQAIAQGLLLQGIQPGDRVALISQTRLDWVVIDMAILMVGAISVPIYASNLADECLYIIEDSGSVLVFTENHSQTEKFISQRSQMPNLRRIVQIDEPLFAASDGFVIGLSVFSKVEKIDYEELSNRRQRLEKDSVLSITYTSGTTGRPKGAVTTHDNMLYVAEAINQIDIVKSDDLQLLFLPLAHVFARVLETAWLATGHVLAFAENMQSIAKNMKEVRPTLMGGVPRVYEKFYDAAIQKGLHAAGLKGLLFKEALKYSKLYGEAEAQGKSLSLFDSVRYHALKVLVFRKIRKALQEATGGNIRLMVSGGAPLSSFISWFFRDADLTLLEGFGLTETTAASCINRPGQNRIGSVGRPLPGTEVKLAEDGELLINSRGVMSGYWKNQQATEASIQDGWFATGDIATIDVDGSVRIVDRKKDLIVTSGGKKIPPQNLENLLKNAPLISQAVVHGEKRNYLTALITLDRDALNQFATAHGLYISSYEALTQLPEVNQEIDRLVQEVNSHLPSYETIKKFYILQHDFSLETGELTPSLKIKRRVIAQRYQHLFDAMYDDSSQA